MNDHVHLKIGIRCLSCVGFWPRAFKNKSLTILYRIYFCTTLSAYVVLVCSQFVEMYLIRNRDLDDVSFLMGIMLFYLQGLVKVWVISGKDIKQLTKTILVTEQNILKGSDRAAKKIYKEYVGQNYAVNCVVIGFALVCGSLFATTPFLTELINPPEILYDVIDNATVVYRPRPLPIVSWFPFDRYKHYRLAYAWHVLILINLPMYILSSDNFLLGIIIFVVGQIKILQKNVTEIGGDEEGADDCDQNVVGENLRKCVEYHKAIVVFVEKLRGTMRTFLLLDFAACGLQVAVIGFQAAVTKISFHLLTTVFYLLTMLTQIFLFYWFGNEILIESEQVAKAIWDSEWYMFDESVKRSLWILMTRAQKPLTLSVGPFYNVSTATMMLIIRTGYSYAAVMRRLYSN